MKSVNPVKMLSALALVLLVFSVTDGLIMNTCELKAKLDAAELPSITAMGENITANNLIARLVCRANRTAFNTSFVKTITVSNKEKISAEAPSKAHPLKTSKASSHDAAKAPPPNTKPSKAPNTKPFKAEGSRNETKRPLSTAAAKGMEHLFGVFQLSDQLACDSGMTSSLNICKMNCNAFLDDDITNDIDCLKILMNSMNPKPKEDSSDFKIAEMLFVKECRSVVPSKLFANCA